MLILTVNENTNGNMPEEEKDMLKLCLESTNVNKKFIEVTAKANESNSWGQDTEYFKDVPEGKVYRYRKFTLENKIHVNCRSEVDAFSKVGDGDTARNVFVKVCALNEYDPVLDWGQNYETNRGALISSEFRNNGSKIGRWLCQAFLADCEQFKLGFVHKTNPKDTKYQVLTVEPMTSNGLSSQTGYTLKDNWSIIKTIVEIMSKQEDGSYSFVKLPYKQSIRIYRLPGGDDSSDQIQGQE